MTSDGFWALFRRRSGGRGDPRPAPRRDPAADQRARARWEGEGGATETGPAQSERDGRPDEPDATARDESSPGN